MDRRLYPQEQVYQLPNKPSKTKNFHFVNTSATRRGSYDSSVRSFVLSGLIYVKKKRRTKRKHKEESKATEQRPRLGKPQLKKQSEAHIKAESPTQSPGQLFSYPKAPISRFEQGPGDPFQCFGRPINLLELQLIDQCMWKSLL